MISTRTPGFMMPIAPPSCFLPGWTKHLLWLPCFAWLRAATIQCPSSRRASLFRKIWNPRRERGSSSRWYGNCLPLGRQLPKDSFMATSTYGYQPPVDAEASLRREALVLQHLPQVRLIAKRIHDRLPDYVSLDDLISTGVIGLLAAIDNFDPSLNVQLNTYAERKIRGAILDGLRDTDWAPREVRKKSELIEAAIHRAKQRVGREATEEEIAAELGIAPAEYQRWLTEVRNVELERLEGA